LSRRNGIIALAVACAALAGGLAYALSPSGSPKAVRHVPNPTAGRVDYRRYCGECHALDAALSAGFGGTGSPGGGPSFDNLRVSFDISEAAIYGNWAGHEALPAKMTIAQIDDVSAYVARVTRHNPIVASMEDG
jgi:mono/diheme cytochrome c family protein